jgi:phytoene synthase
VDDIADGDLPEAEKIAALSAWRGHVERLFAGAPDHTVTRALAPVVAQFGLRQADMDAVIDGMEMDARGPIVAPSQATLDLYCDRVAAAVGRLCIRVFGEPTPAGAQVAEHLGRALQLTNILRDVAEDAAIGRLYLPRELLDRAGVTVTTPQATVTHANMARVLAPLGEMAEQAFADSARAIALCDRQAMRPAVIMMKVYHRTLVRLRVAGWPVNAPRSPLARVLGRIEKLALALYYGLV